MSGQTAVVGDIETFLSEIIKELEEVPAPSGRGRPRIVPALALWSGVLVCVLHGFKSQLEVWRAITLQGLWHYPRYEVTDDAVYKRLAQMQGSPLEVLFEQVTELLAERLRPLQPSNVLAGFASGVFALDESSLDQVARHLPSLRELAKGELGLLGGKLTALFDIRLQQWRKVQVQENATQNEKVAARRMLRGLPKGSLLLADLGYFAFEWFDDLTDAGFYWLSKLRAKTSYELIHTHYQAGDTLDALIWLGKHRSDRAKHAVRLVQYRHKGSLRRYITNVLEPELLPLQDIVYLYARRWDIELAFKLIKRHLNLHLLWSAKRSVMLQQIFAVLTISQVLLGLRSEIARRAEVDDFDVSMALLVRYIPKFTAQTQDFIELILDRGAMTGFIRPHSRLSYTTPEIPLAACLSPPEQLVLLRTPRYAGRKC